MTARLWTSLLFCSAAMASTAHAAETTARMIADDFSDAIVVKGQAITADEAAYSTTTLTNDDIRQQSVSDFDELLKFVPGMTVRDFGLGGVANSIVIRGFGNGGHGGDLGAVVDGISLNEAMSHADGYVDLNIIVPLEVDALTVYRGPVSAQYGNYNRGGLLKVDTRKSGEYLNADVLAGSFDSFDVQLAGGHDFGAVQWNGAAQIFSTDGFRPQSAEQRQTVSSRLSAKLAPGVTLALGGRYHNAKADSASYLTAEQFASDPYGIDARVQNDGSDKEYLSGRADLSVDLAPSLTLVSYAYVTGQDFSRWFTRPTGSGWRQREESYERKVFGAGTSLNGTVDASFASAPIEFVAGIETVRESTDFLFFDGLDNRTRTNAAANDRETRLNAFSGFAEAHVPLAGFIDLSLGLRADNFSGGCALNGPEVGDDPCGAIDGVFQLSPKAGIRAQVTDWMQLRASWSQGFALPDEFVKYSVGGQEVNPNLFQQTELGFTLTPLAGLSLDVAAFQMDSSQEVRTVAPGLYENFGETRRQGIEVSSEWQVTNRLSLRGVYSHVDTDVRVNGDPSLIGLSVAGVPDHTANVDVRWTPLDDWTLAGNWRYVGAYEVNAGNTAQSRAYDTFDLALSHDLRRAGTTYQLYLRVDNFADKAYGTSYSLIGGEALVAPGAPRSFRAGVKVSL